MDMIDSDTVIISGDDIRAKYRNIAIAGGGVYGCAALGALVNLHKRNMLHNLHNFSGTSVGAIIAAALACGATFGFLHRELCNLDFESLLDCNSKIRGTYNLYNHYGYCSGSAMMQWFESFIEKLTGDKNITLYDIYIRFNNRLIITGTKVGKVNNNESLRKLEFCQTIHGYETVYFDHRTHPNMPLKLALRISTSIPLIFMPVIYDGYFWADGGMLDNYPINVFDDDSCFVETIGLSFINDNSQISTPDSIFTYVHSLFACYMSRNVVNLQDYSRTITINCKEYSSLDFRIDNNGRNNLLKYGYEAVDKYFGEEGILKRQYTYNAENISGPVRVVLPCNIADIVLEITFLQDISHEITLLCEDVEAYKTEIIGRSCTIKGSQIVEYIHENYIFASIERLYCIYIKAADMKSIAISAK